MGSVLAVARPYASRMVAVSSHARPVGVIAAMSMLKLGPAPAVSVAMSPSGMAVPPQPLPLMAQNTLLQGAAAQLKPSARLIVTAMLLPTTNSDATVSVKVKSAGAGSSI